VGALLSAVVSGNMAGVHASDSRWVGIHPDWTAPPVWLFDEAGAEICNGIGALPLAATTVDRLKDWGRRWDVNLTTDGQSEDALVEEALLRELTDLAADLRTELGPEYRIDLRVQGA
jgi:hypothetical protein